MNMKTILIAGGGFAGCAAAVAAKKAGADVLLFEKTDMLLGTGLVGGIMRNNGRFTAAEELISMGGGELFQIIEQNLRHKNINFPGHKHADLFDIGRISPEIKRYLDSLGINIFLQTRIINAAVENHKLISVSTQSEQSFSADVFIDATGSAGPISNCQKYGNGCAMCILRCPSFGGRLSLTALSGIPEFQAYSQNNSLGSMSGSCKLHKNSLSDDIKTELETKGVIITALPDFLQENHLAVKCCQQYASQEFSENLILLDTGHAKLMTPYYPLDKLHQIQGFEHARYEDPYAGGKGNSMRFFAIAPNNNSLKVQGIHNLFCAGEKTGPLVGHTEAIVTGTLAGYNAVQYAGSKTILEYPTALACGDLISYMHEQLKTNDGFTKKYTFSGSIYFNRMLEKQLYTTDVDLIRSNVEKCGWKDIFNV